MGQQDERITRVITATARFDGHDVAINIMRRVMQSQGAEIIHLGHNRRVSEVVLAAIQEDADAIAVSSYQGGHVEYFTYLIDLLTSHHVEHIKVFGGGGGVIVPSDRQMLEDYGVARIFSPEDGRVMGLEGMIAHLLELSSGTHQKARPPLQVPSHCQDTMAISQCISAIEWAHDHERVLPELIVKYLSSLAGDAPVIGLTGTGGAGKSSLLDELIGRFVRDFPEKQIAVLCVDPTRKRSGGALLGDRIRINQASCPCVFIRSLATRQSSNELSAALTDSIQLLKAVGFDLIIVESTGIGQSQTHLVNRVDASLYVMTPEYGAATQLEKIDMLDAADWVVVNKQDRCGAQDAYQAVRKQVQRNRQCFDQPLDTLPVFATTASHFNDAGVNHLYQQIIKWLTEKQEGEWDGGGSHLEANRVSMMIPPERKHYLSIITQAVRQYDQHTEQQAAAVEQRWHRQAVTTQDLGDDGEAVDQATDSLLAAYQSLHDAADEATPVERMVTTLSGLSLPRVVLPSFTSPADQYRWMRGENAPGYFPYTAGVFRFKRHDEAVGRMFAGEGGPEKTNQRFRYLTQNSETHRLSTAFDSVTLYGEDPDEPLDIMGKIGNAGVSIATLDDMALLYKGFDLCAPTTSVSMTINGPAPILLAQFFNVAYDQQRDIFREKQGRWPNKKEDQALMQEVHRVIRGTLQADILKEDQGQNTCIFSIEFALKMMGDMQEWMIHSEVKRFYSVSISGYHMAEAGANPITQLAFTLANALTYVEYYLSRGMKVDDFAKHFSFFFSMGLDAEYVVMMRVARRIWAIVMRDVYGANERSQQCKVHVQTSGRSLHAQDIEFNDIRTTLEALMALNDQCNSLHTNAYDEAITTPTEASVRRAQAIQLIIEKERGLSQFDNVVQGSFVMDRLTTEVEAAVLEELDRLAERGGVLPAMELGYQRACIQEQSMAYEHGKMTGAIPVVGVNTFVDTTSDQDALMDQVPLQRSTKEERCEQIARLKAFQARHCEQSGPALNALKQAVLNDDNIFEQLLTTVRYCSLGQITEALYSVGGAYRRNM